MGRQINFHRHQDDQEDFDKLLKSMGDIVLMPYYHYDGKVSTVEDTIIRDIKKEGSRVYAIRRQDFRDIKLQHIEKFGYWLIDDSALPVVHFVRCATNDHRLERGRIYFQTSYLVRETMTIVNKPNDFLKWGDRIISAFRRKLKTCKLYPGSNSTQYVGEHADQWRSLNRAEMRQGSLQSTILN